MPFAAALALFHVFVGAAQADCQQPRTRIATEEAKKIEAKFLGFNLGGGLAASRSATYEALVPDQDALTYEWTSYLLCSAHSDGRLTDAAYCTLSEAAGYRAVGMEPDMAAIEARCTALTVVAEVAPVVEPPVVPVAVAPVASAPSASSPVDTAPPAAAPASPLGQTLPDEACVEHAECVPAAVCWRGTCELIDDSYVRLTIVQAYVVGIVDEDGSPPDLMVGGRCFAAMMPDTTRPMWMQEDCTFEYSASYPPDIVLYDTDQWGTRERSQTELMSVTLSAEEAARVFRSPGGAWVGTPDRRIHVRLESAPRR